jgi:hypothetical protein
LSQARYPGDIYVLHHAGCNDGLFAALAAWKRLGYNHQGAAVTYMPQAYGQPPPSLRQDSTVYILDFFYPLDQMMKLHQEHDGRVWLIDHHLSAIKQLQGRLPNCILDLDHSAAVLAWQFFHPDDPVPELFRYIQDADLWTWQLDNSQEVSAGLKGLSRSFGALDQLDLDTLRQRGAVIHPFERAQVRSLTGRPQWRNIAGHRVPVVNTQGLASEVCHRLLEKYPEAPFAATYYETGGKSPQDPMLRRWSLRSRTHEDFDVSLVAEALGGGGHSKASGFQQEIPQTTATNPE